MVGLDISVDSESMCVCACVFMQMTGCMSAAVCSDMFCEYDSVELYMSEHDDTWGDYNEALMI